MMIGKMRPGNIILLDSAVGTAKHRRQRPFLTWNNEADIPGTYRVGAAHGRDLCVVSGQFRSQPWAAPTLAEAFHNPWGACIAELP